MPITRFRRNRRTFRKRRSMGFGPLVQRRRRPMTVGRVKKIIGAELKFRLVDFRDSAFTLANPTLVRLSEVSQGDGNFQREGNRITPVNLHGHVTVVGDTTMPTNTTDVRVAIFRWNEDESSNAPAAEDIMEDPAELGGPYNINNRGMFKIVWSRYFTLVNNADNSAFRRTLRFYVKLSSPKVLFDGTDLKKFHYFLMILSNSTELSEPTATANITFRFTDS